MRCACPPRSRSSPAPQEHRFGHRQRRTRSAALGRRQLSESAGQVRNVLPLTHMPNKWPALLMCVLTSTNLAVAGQELDSSTLSETIRSIYLARQAEKSGDPQSAAQKYLTAISYLESSAPRDVD